MGSHGITDRQEHRRFLMNNLDASKCKTIKQWRVVNRASYVQISNLVHTHFNSTVTVNSNSHWDGKNICDVAREKLREPRSEWENF